jgi:hypothetical protein
MIDPSLFGDLLEERARGRSRAWYWRQVAVAVARAIFDQARRHPVLTVRAIATTLAVYFAASGIVYFVYGYLSGYLSPGLGDPYTLRWFLFPLISLPSAVAGYAMARTHRACSEAALATIVLVWGSIAIPINAWTPSAQFLGLTAGALIASYWPRLNALK